MIPCCYSCIDKDYLIYFNWFLFTLSSMPYSLCPVLLDHESDASTNLSISALTTPALMTTDSVGKV